MSLFGSPPKPTPVAAMATPAQSATGQTNVAPAGNVRPSLISTAAQGLTRKAKTQKTSLIGGV